MLLNRRTDPCVTLIFPRSIVPPSVSTASSRCSIRLRQPDSGQTYPPYNIERTGEDSYRITMAVAGFSDERDLDRGPPQRADRQGRAQG